MTLKVVIKKYKNIVKEHYWGKHLGVFFHKGNFNVYVCRSFLSTHYSGVIISSRD